MVFTIQDGLESEAGEGGTLTLPHFADPIRDAVNLYKIDWYTLIEQSHILI